MSHNIDLVLTQTLPFGNTPFTSCKNLEILIATTDSIFSTKRFDELNELDLMNWMSHSNHPIF